MVMCDILLLAEGYWKGGSFVFEITIPKEYNIKVGLDYRHTYGVTSHTSYQFCFTVRPLFENILK